MRTLAIIPARAGSKRLPGKNVRDFAGLPLVAWSIRFARALDRFDVVALSTDGEEIAAIGRAEGLDVPELRPAALSGDAASSAAVALHELDRLAARGERFYAIALLQPTSPVRYAERWTEAFAHLELGNVDAVVGVAPVRNHPFHTFARDVDGQLTPFVTSRDDLRSLRSQDLPPAYAIAGNLYLVRVPVLYATGTFFPPSTVGVVCDHACESMDIDTQADWDMAEALTRHYGQQSCPRS